MCLAGFSHKISAFAHQALRRTNMSNVIRTSNSRAVELWRYQYGDDKRHTLCYCPSGMKKFDWNADKNQQLIADRGVSFEEVIFFIQEGRLLDDLKHPNEKKYPRQRIFVVDIDDYAYLIPYVEDKEVIFLKTIIPSRVATKQYIGDLNG